MIPKKVVLFILFLNSLTIHAAEKECLVAKNIYDSVSYFTQKMNIKPNDGQDITHVTIDSEAFNEWYMFYYTKEFDATIEKYLKYEDVEDESVIGEGILSLMAVIDMVQFYKNHLDLIEQQPQRAFTEKFPDKVIKAYADINKHYIHFLKQCELK